MSFRSAKTVVTDRIRRQILRLTSNSTISSAKIIDQLALKMSRSAIDRVRRKAPHLQYKKLKAQPDLKAHHIQKKKKIWSRAYDLESEMAKDGLIR
jgi:hypothetical protein